MDEEKEKEIEAAMKTALRDPVVVKEIQRMRDRGLSEVYVQNWLRQIVLLNRK